MNSHWRAALAPPAAISENHTNTAKGLSYYTREMCISKGYLPSWTNENYTGETYFEKLFKTPLNIDLLAAGHSGRESGFEQVTARWGCNFAESYGTGTNKIGFFGVGPKDPAGGGCPKGPVKVYEDLVCAIKLGFESNPEAFKDFCSTKLGAEEGMFECLSFFAHVLTETGAFAETEERDPRPYCWNRHDGNTECCPASDHKPCMEDSDRQLSPGDYPENNLDWLTEKETKGKCCSYHGRGFLQVSYEPNYKALSKAMLNDESVLWKYPYKLVPDSVAGWTSALWFWFNKHDAQVAVKENIEPVKMSPRDAIQKWREGFGLPGSIAIINGAECTGAMSTDKARQRTAFLFAIAHRMRAVPPKVAGDKEIDYYPLPGTEECEQNTWCRSQFHNSKSACPVFNSHVTCNFSDDLKINASTPMGWNRKVLRLTNRDNAMSVCEFGSAKKETPALWKEKQEKLQPIDKWWTLLDVTIENVCDYAALNYEKNDKEICAGNHKNCSEVCWKDFTDELSVRGQKCEQPQKPCLTFANYVSRPLPKHNYESGKLGDYKDGAYLGRVGPQLVIAMNELAFGDRRDTLCYIFGGTTCHWNIGMGTRPKPEDDTHNCRIYPPSIDPRIIDQTLKKKNDSNMLNDPKDRPAPMKKVLEFYADDKCPEGKGDTILEKVMQDGRATFDWLFSDHYSASDGFANKRWDEFEDKKVNYANAKFGRQGPSHAWRGLLCAYLRGIPDDPEIFKRELWKKTPSTNSNFTEDEINFAKLELASYFANVIKETGALSQMEEQDARAYCNHMGGSGAPCCPNDFGNNPACTDRGVIGKEELDMGLSSEATCCSYHGRGPLQISYEKNYYDIGYYMLADKKNGVTNELAAKYMNNYPQTIEPWTSIGWTSSLLFWLKPHPCQFCEGRKANTTDYNAKMFAPHEAMVKYDQINEGFGKVVNIINGAECEAALAYETPRSMLGAQQRLTLFYNLAYRWNIKEPGSMEKLPLPGTAECLKSNWCKTFLPSPSAPFGRESGSCWALTPQTAEDGESKFWTYCKIGKDIFNAETKLGVEVNLPSFTLSKDPGAPDSKTAVLHDFKCGTKKLKEVPEGKTSEDLMLYYKEVEFPADAYKDPSKRPPDEWCVSEICSFARNGQNENNDKDKNCEKHCLAKEGGGRCLIPNAETGKVLKGGEFIDCVNDYFQSVPELESCWIYEAEIHDGGWTF